MNSVTLVITSTLVFHGHPSILLLVLNIFFSMNSLNSTSLEEAIQNLRAVTEELITVKSRLNTRADKEVIEALEEKHKTYTEIVGLHQHFQQVANSTCSLNIIKESPIQFRVPSNLPTLSAQSTSTVFDIYHFLEAYEAILEGSGVNIQAWPRILLTTIPSTDHATIRVIRNTLTGLEWSEVRKKLIEHYDTPEIERKFIKEFLSLQKQSEESMSHFADRVSLLIERAKLNPSSGLVRDKFLSALPVELRRQLGPIALKTKSFQELAEEAIALDSLEASLKQLALSQPRDKQEIFVKKCTFCKNKGHDLAECRKFAYKESNTFNNFTRDSTRQQENSSSKKLSLQQFNNPEKVHAFNRSAYPQSKYPKVSACIILNNKPINEKLKLEEDPKHEISNFPSLVTIPISINSFETSGTIDTGAQVSILSHHLSERINAKVVPTNLKIGQIAVNSQSPALGITEGALVSFNGKVIPLNFVIMETDNKNQCLLGIDFFKAAGLYIGGFEYNHSQPQPREYSVQETEEQYYADSIRLPILENLQEHLKSNSLTANSRCTAPEATVSLDTGQHKPSWVNQYPVAQSRKEILDKQIQDWLETDVITLAKGGSQWNSPLLIVPKKGKPDEPPKFRICIDPRHLNSKLDDDRYPLATLRELMDLVAGATVFSSLDLKNSYHQLPLREEDQCKTAFSWNGVQYKFRGAPFGIKTLPAIFQRLMSHLFCTMSFVFVYLDDILIFSKSIEDHERHLKLVIDKLTSVNLTLNTLKCKLICTKLNHLGHVLSAKGVEIDPSKRDDALNWPIPKTAKDVQSFLGFINFFRDFIPQFATISKPLDEIRYSQNVEKVWDIRHHDAFLMLKRMLVSAPLLAFPDFSLPFILATDASAYAIGGYLYQGDTENKQVKAKRIIKFASRSLNASERKYSASKRELLSIVYCLNKFSNYLLGQKFIVMTDHKPLTYLFSQKKLAELQQMWLDTFLKFNFEIVYCPGKNNQIPDAISRIFPDAYNEPDAQEPIVSQVVTNKDHSCSYVELSNNKNVPQAVRIKFKNECRKEKLAAEEEYRKDDQQLKQNMKINNPTEDYEHSATHTRAVETTNQQEGITCSNQKQLLLDLHLINHANAKEMFAKLKQEKKSWPNMMEDCRAVCRSCPACQRFTIVKSGYHPQQSLKSSLPMDHIVIDLIGPLETSQGGENYILIIIDVFSRYIFLVAIKDKAAMTIATELFRIFCLFGPPKILQSDNGTEFNNSILHHTMSLFTSAFRHSTPYYPQCNGIVERAVRTSLDLIRKEVTETGISWSILLPTIQLRLNQRMCSTTKCIPFEAMFARKAFLFNTEITELNEPSENEIKDRLNNISSIIFPAIAETAAKTCDSRNKYWNKTHLVNCQFQPQQLVMIKNNHPTHKFDVRYFGPYKVLRKTKGGSYILTTDANTQLPRAFAPKMLKLVQGKEATNEFFVEDILDHKLVNNQLLFKTRWFGYLPSDDTWEPRSSFHDQAVVDNYLSRFPDLRRE